MEVAFMFFFFQAEDGIRDPLVTGVQTCALPILPVAASVVLSETIGVADRVRAENVLAGMVKLVSKRPLSAVVRSEERRVGKECRSGWSTYQEKKEHNLSRGGTARYESMSVRQRD